MIAKFFDRYGSAVFGITLFGIYLTCISGNSTVDSWGYAADIVNGVNLLRPHHLLYSITGYYWVRISHLLFPMADTLLLLKWMNALAASLAILVFVRMLKLLGVDSVSALLIGFLVGLSWGFLRFAVDAEAYVIPILISVIASYLYHYAIALNNKTLYYLGSGFFAALACLFHQVMFFWWLALAMHVVLNKGSKTRFIFLLSAAIVPLAYLVAIKHQGMGISIRNLMQYVFHDYVNGNASVEFGLNTFLIGLINIFRTFLQLHGYMAYLINQNWLWFIPFAITLIAITAAMRGIIKDKCKPKVDSQFRLVHLIVLIMQVSFAFLSGGNAEFMAMVPVLAGITFSGVNVGRKSLFMLVIAVTVWNISFGVIPAKIYPSDSTCMVLDKVKQQENTKTAYILAEAPMVINRLEYYGIQKPLLLRTEKLTRQELSLKVDSLLGLGYSIYTDCLNRPSPTSRSTMIGLKNLNIKNFEGYNVSCIDSALVLGGTVYLHQIIGSKLQ